MSFLKGSLVTMADGSKKKIEDIVVGNIVKDGQGTNAFVRGRVNLKYHAAFYDVFNNKIQNPIKINNEIICMKDQHFLGADGNFYIFNGLDNEINRNPGYAQISFITESGCIQSFSNYIIQNKIKKLEIGSVIMKDTGPVEINSIEHLPKLQVIPPKKHVWNDFYFSNNDNIDGLEMAEFLDTRDDVIKHKLGFRGTYIVDGYICLAMQNHFWDYDNDCLDKTVETGAYVLKVNKNGLIEKDNV